MPRNWPKQEYFKVDSYYTYFVVIDGQGKLDLFYLCEEQYYQLTKQEFDLLTAITPEPHNLMNNSDIAFYKLAQLRARYCLGEFKIFKSPVPLDKEHFQKLVEK
jgi:hypothetical protein